MHVIHVVLGTYGVVCMVVQVVLSACCTCGSRYIWGGVHGCISDVLCMWCCLHVVQVVMCACVSMYMSCI